MQDAKNPLNKRFFLYVQGRKNTVLFQRCNSPVF